MNLKRASEKLLRPEIAYLPLNQAARGQTWPQVEWTRLVDIYKDTKIVLGTLYSGDWAARVSLARTRAQEALDNPVEPWRRQQLAGGVDNLLILPTPNNTLGEDSIWPGAVAHAACRAILKFEAKKDEGGVSQENKDALSRMSFVVYSAVTMSFDSRDLLAEWWGQLGKEAASEVLERFLGQAENPEAAGRGEGWLDVIENPEVREVLLGAATKDAAGRLLKHPEREKCGY